MSKITDYNAKSSPATDDVLVIVDTHDGSQSAAGTTKKAAIGSLPFDPLGAAATETTRAEAAEALLLGHSLDWINVTKAPYSADPTGVADSTTAIGNAISAVPAGGGVVYLPAGTYLLNGSSALALATQGTTIAGAGPYATNITVGSGFTGSSVFHVTASNCQIRDLSITGPGAGATNTFNAIEIGNNVSRARLTDLYFTGVPGWLIESISGSGGTNSDHMYRSINARSNAGGIHLKASGGSHRECFLTDINCQQTGAGTGGAANLDTFLFEDVLDVTCVNFNSGQTAPTTGSAIHILGACAALFFVSMDISGNAAAGPVVKIEAGTNGKPSGVHFVGLNCNAGSVGAQIGNSGTDGTQKIRFENTVFSGSTTHGLWVQGNGIELTFANCEWGGNGTGATGTNYDIYWQGTASGRIHNSHFSNTPVAPSSAGVQQNVSLPSNNFGGLSFWNIITHDSSNTLTQFFGSNLPQVYFFPSISAAILNVPGNISASNVSPSAAPAAFHPSSPTGTSSTTLVMMGLGATCTYTPIGTGKVLVNVAAYATIATAPTGIVVGGRYGTGTAPNNGDAVTGTRFGPAGDPGMRSSASTGNANSVAAPFTDVLTLTPGTTYWFDLAVATTNAADAASVNSISMTFLER